MHARRTSRANLLRGLGKLVAVGALAGGGGLALGLGISHLSGNTVASTPPPARIASTTTQPAAPAAASPAPQAAPDQVSVRVVSAVLHPAATAFGLQRQRGRLIVQIVARNQGTQRVTPTRPALLAAGVATRTDAHADAPGTRLAPIAAGASEKVALQFEVAGAVTAQLTGQRSARILVAGRLVPISVVVGPPVAPPATPGP